METVLAGLVFVALFVALPMLVPVLIWACTR